MLQIQIFLITTLLILRPFFIYCFSFDLFFGFVFLFFGGFICLSDFLPLICSVSLAGWTRYSLMGDPVSGEHSLLIDSVDLEDDAVYECQATQAGLRSHRAKLTVLGKKYSSCQGWQHVSRGEKSKEFLHRSKLTKMFKGCDKFKQNLYR